MKLCLDCSTQFSSVAWQCPSCRAAPVEQDGFLCFAPDLSQENDGFRADFFSELAVREAAHFWFRSRNRLLVWALHKYFPEAHNLLEIGCGTAFVLGALRQAFPKLQLAGSEIYCQALQFARTRVPDVPLYQMDARRIPFVEEFEVVAAFDVLEHVEADADVLRQMFRACRIGGGVIITVPQHPRLWSAVDQYAFHRRRYTRGELLGKMRAVGFTLLRATSFVSLLLPVMLMARLRQRRLPEGFNKIDDFNLNPLMNAILEKVMIVEGGIIRLGFPLPLGGSLMVIGMRKE
jgi:SAM-dependent methyltransferase